MKTWCLIMVFVLGIVHANAQGIQMPKDTTIIHSAIKLKPDLVAPNHYSQNLAFFCRLEISFEKQFHVPLIFRLGSVDYNNWLEQKTGNIYKPWQP